MYAHQGSSFRQAGADKAKPVMVALMSELD